MRTAFLGGAALLAAVQFGAPAAAKIAVIHNLLVNPGFEDTGFSGPGGFQNLGFASARTAREAAPGDFGWIPDNIDLVDNGHYSQYLANGGKYNIDLVGYGSKGAIAQTVATRIGSRYTVAFDYSKTRDSPAPTVTVSLNGAKLDTVIGTSGWRHFSETFTAVSTSYLLNISSLGQYNSGVLIDNVALDGPLATIPEASTWAMMILGVVLVGVTQRRRSRMTVAS